VNDAYDRDPQVRDGGRGYVGRGYAFKFWAILGMKGAQFLKYCRIVSKNMAKKEEQRWTAMQNE
jgi:hypothetical protein